MGVMSYQLHWSVQDVPVVADLDEDALVGVAVEWERIRAFVDAQQQASFAELVRRRVAAATPLPIDQAPTYSGAVMEAQARAAKWCASEFAPALRLAEITAQHRVQDAVLLLDRYPAVWQALSDGIITNPKARIFVESLANLDPELAAKVVEKTLPDAGDYTPGQLRKKIQRACITVDPQAAEERHEQAKQERRVQGAPGMTRWPGCGRT